MVDTSVRRIIGGWAVHRKYLAPLMRLVERYPNGEKKINTYDAPIYPFFAARLCDEDGIKDFYARKSWMGGIHKITPYPIPFLLGKETPIKVEVFSHKEVGRFRDIMESDGIKTYLSDIPFIRNVMIQKDIFMCHDGNFTPIDCQIPLRYAAVDVETDDRDGKIEPGKDIILSVSVVDMQTGETWCIALDEEMNSEKQLIIHLISLLWNYDVALAWSAEFDFETLMERSRIHGIKFDWRAIPFVDYMAAFRMVQRRPSSEKLAIVSEREINERGCNCFKYISVEDYFNLWITDAEAFKKANISHSEAIYRLEHGCPDCGVPGLNIVRTLQLLSDRAGIFIQDVTSRGIFNDVLTLRKLRDRYVLGNREYGGEKGQFKGARVIEPTAGRYRNAFIADLKSLYNRIAQVFLISPEILYRFFDAHHVKAPIGPEGKERRVLADEINNLSYKEITTLSEVFPWEKYLLFAKTYQAVHGNYYLEALQLSEALREEYREKMEQYEEGSAEWQVCYDEQYFAKQQLLIFYGMAGSTSARVYYKIAAALITDMGRKTIEMVKTTAQDMGFKVIGGDTDSVFAEPPPNKTADNFIEVCVDKLNEFVESYGLHPQYGLDIKIDEETYSFVHTAVKKRYYYMTLDGKQKVKGIQTERADSFELLRSVMKTVMDMALKYVDEDIILVYLRTIRDRLSNGEFDDKLVISKAMQKSLKDYKTNIPHIKAARQVIDSGGSILKGERVYYVIASEVKRKTDVQAVIDDNVPEIHYTGRKWYWEKRIIRQILDLISPCYNVKAFEDLLQMPDPSVRTLVEWS